MTVHRHEHPEPAPTVERVEVTRASFRRGSGCCEEAPVRMVTAYYDVDGALLVEIDPLAAGVDSLDVETGADAHSGWYLYEMERDGRSKHASEWLDCTVAICRERASRSREAPA